MNNLQTQHKQNGVENNCYATKKSRSIFKIMEFLNACKNDALISNIRISNLHLPKFGNASITINKSLLMAAII